jgi:hypothetical protein
MLPVILNQSDGKWAFDNLAQMLSRSLWIDISENPSDVNYVLCVDTELVNNSLNSFIPLKSIKIASDKRDIEKRFKSDRVARPTTFSLESLLEVESFLKTNRSNRWILKYPIL